MRLVQRLSARTFFLAYAAFIVYATSVPFHFDRLPTLQNAMLIPFRDAGRVRIHSIRDLVQNFILFFPFAILGALRSWPARLWPCSAWAASGARWRAPRAA